MSDPLSAIGHATADPAPSPGPFRIVKAQFPVAMLFGHDLIALLDADGRLLREANGLATSRQGRIKPIGYLPSDRLKVYEFSAPALYRAQQRQLTLCTGSWEEVSRHWRVLRAAASALNARHLRYPMLGFGPNSNSVATTLIAAMGLADPDLAGRCAPGRRTLLLDAGTLAALRERHGMGGAPVPA